MIERVQAISVQDRGEVFMGHASQGPGERLALACRHSMPNPRRGGGQRRATQLGRPSGATRQDQRVEADPHIKGSCYLIPVEHPEALVTAIVSWLREMVRLTSTYSHRHTRFSSRIKPLVRSGGKCPRPGEAGQFARSAYPARSSLEWMPRTLRLPSSIAP